MGDYGKITGLNVEVLGSGARSASRWPCELVNPPHLAMRRKGGFPFVRNRAALGQTPDRPAKPTSDLAQRVQFSRSPPVAAIYPSEWLAFLCYVSTS